MSARALVVLLSVMITGCSRVSTAPEPRPRAEPRVEVAVSVVQPRYVHLEWRIRGGQGLEFVVQRSHNLNPWKNRAALTPDEQGLITFDDASVVPGQSYSYRVRIPGLGASEFQGYVSVVPPTSSQHLP